MSSTLILAEHGEGQLRGTTLTAIACAQHLAALTGQPFDILVIGSDNTAIVPGVTGWGARRVLSAQHTTLHAPLAHTHAEVIRHVVNEAGSTLIIGTASTFTKDILPRAAGMLDAGMVSDVIGIEAHGSGLRFERVLFAGNAIATVELDGPIRFLTIRASAFAPPSPASAVSPVIPLNEWNFQGLPDVRLVSREERSGGRPDATESRVIVSGGRALKTSEDFERLVGGLADALGAAVGSSRALVDSGITANSLQIGQTGKIVAPDLYIALGISGAIQHMAGMKDTKVIVAINKDPDAPIFEVANYGLVADVYQAVPEWIEKARVR